MSEKPPLSDNQAHDALMAAHAAVTGRQGATVRAETALRTAERALAIIALGLLVASEKDSDRLECLTDQKPPSP